MLFPDSGPTRLLLDRPDDGLPIVRRIGGSDDALALAGPRGTPLLIEQWRGSFARPGLRGHRPDGSDWSTRFVTRSVDAGATLVIDAADDAAGLALRTEVEALTGGALRIRHVVTNTGDTDYVVDGLEVTVPVPDRCTELLDFTGRHERERTPQRHALTDGLWLREIRRGRTGLEAPTLLVAGVPGFGFGAGEVVRRPRRAQRQRGAARRARPGRRRDDRRRRTAAAGRDRRWRRGSRYATPWLVLIAGDGLDELAAAVHSWQRSLPAHPGEQPVTLNVWEAVYFDHDLDAADPIADRARTHRRRTLRARRRLVRQPPRRHVRAR